jgi:hypothetical protein
VRERPTQDAGVGERGVELIDGGAAAELMVMARGFFFFFFQAKSVKEELDSVFC